MENQNLHVFKTSRGGVKLNRNGFIYEKNNVRGKKYYWLCELRRNPHYKCSGRLTTMLNDENVHINVSKVEADHNHEPDALREKVDTVIRKVKEESINNPEKKPCHIIMECEAGTSSVVLQHVPSNVNMKQIIYRQKKKLHKINEPSDIQFEIKREYFECEENNMNMLILIDKKYNNDRRIVIYTTKTLLTYLCSSKYVIMDGTFKVVPKIFYQLYVIHGTVHDASTFPLVFALCTNKDKNSYNKLFAALTELCEQNELVFSPRFVLMDFEKAANKSIATNFENAKVKGCNFHLGQIIYRKVQRCGHQTLYGTSENFAADIKCIYALAFLPANEIPIYFDELLEKCSPEAKNIVKWFGEDYVWGNETSPPKYNPKVWSTHELTKEKIPRTQNSAESWHNRFLHVVGHHHPGFYYFSKKIVQEIKHQTCEIDKLVIGGPPPTKKKRYADKMSRIDTILGKKAKYHSKYACLLAIANNLKLK